MDSLGCLAFDKQQTAFGEQRAGFQPFEFLQERSRKGTKEAFAAKLVHHATVFDCETVGAWHCAIMDF